MIQFKNCNSIDSGSIDIQPGKLNIKFAINGTGKSTIAKALELIMRGESLADLVPFKHRESGESTCLPEVTGFLPGQVMIFNDEYVSQFVFKPDEVLNNSFEIFIKTTDFVSHAQEIETAIKEIRNTFHDSEIIDRIIADMATLSGSFGKPTKKKGYAESSAVARGPGRGNKLINIPAGLEGYSLYLQSDANTKWIKWQLDGNSFNQNPGHCPYCTSSTAEKEEVIRKVAEEFDASYIGHVTQMTAIMERLQNYFTSDTQEKISAILKSPEQLADEHYNFLLEVKGQVDILMGKLKTLKNLGFISMKDIGKLDDMFSSLKIDLGYLSHLGSGKTTEIIDPLNVAIDGVIAKIGPLTGAVNRQKANIQRTIQKNKQEINDFLKTAGYRYEVEVEEREGTYKMQLKHQDHSVPITSGTKHLSYGEKNAFSLVLFMYECLAKNPDFIILDDPISSFDKNKKYAVMHMLFRGNRCLRGRTVLMLTHDFEPVIDIGYTLRQQFQHPTPPFITFIRNQSGAVTEKQIQRDDIKTFQDICRSNINTATTTLVKAIFLRRLAEIEGNKGVDYHLLSNLLHKRPVPRTGSAEEEPPMDPADVSDAVILIRESIPGFDYNIAVAEVTNETFMLGAYQTARSNYEKLQIFRIHNDGHLSGNNVIDKFINEVFHIENDYIMQLDPSHFEIVPDYIISECDKILGLNQEDIKFYEIIDN